MSHPYLDPSFLPNWDALTPDSVEDDITRALSDAQSALDAVAATSASDATYESTFLALEAATEPLQKAWGLVNHLDSVNNSPELREAMNKMLPPVSAFFASISLNDDLYAALKAAAEKPETQAFTGAKRRFVDETLAEFVQEGAELGADQKTRLKQIKQELAEKTQKFSEHVLDSTNAFEKIVTNEDDLVGLPETAKAAARQNAASKGHGSESEPAWRFTLNIPSFLPVLQYADNEELRKELWLAFNAVASEGETDNSSLIWEILALRREQAELLGKAQFADVVLERRMAKNGASALSFVEDLHARVLEKFQAEVSSLAGFAATGTPQDGMAGAGDHPQLEPWQATYFQEKLRRELYDIDDEEMRPYFPINEVISGLFSLTGTVFGITVTEKTGADKPSVWHPEVRFYEIRDSADGQHLGSFYADWHPRESKRAGAWMNYFSTGARGEGTHEPHLGLICGNLTAPVGDKPALLTHREVETIFHEFGHLLHHLLGNVSVKSLNGVNVAWDFVELPSQIMENWTWQRESLNLFARHHETGEQIPADLFDRMIKARNFMSASLMVRQLSFGKMDLELHVNYDEHKGKDLDALLTEMLASYRPPTPTRHLTNVRSFNHLFSSPVGYAAGYYSYKWAEVLEADAFTRFLDEGILNEKTGREFRERVLSKGNSKDPAELFRDFMGRDPDPEALLIRDGLA